VLGSMHLYNAGLAACYVSASTSLRRFAWRWVVQQLHASANGATRKGNPREDRHTRAHREIDSIVESSVEDFAHLSERERRAMGRADHIADLIARVAGSMPFAALNAVFFALWLLLNSRIGGLPAVDPYPFGALTVIVSLEAIFLSVFVLMSQNRQTAASDRRASIDMHMDAIAEREITKVLEVLDEMRQELVGQKKQDAELQQMIQRTDVKQLVDAVEKTEEKLADVAEADSARTDQAPARVDERKSA
jgi:uncharacterized membrane protein